MVVTEELCAAPAVVDERDGDVMGCLGFILGLCGYLPAIIITIIAFFINPIMGALLCVFFGALFIGTCIYKISEIRKGKL